MKMPNVISWAWRSNRAVVEGWKISAPVEDNRWAHKITVAIGEPEIYTAALQELIQIGPYVFTDAGSAERWRKFNELANLEPEL